MPTEPFFTYFRYGFVVVDVNATVQLPDTPELEGTNLACPVANSDIAGIGVVTSFLIAGLMTTFASIIAAILESRINEGPILLPGFLHRWLGRRMNDVKRERCRFWRDIFERLILNLADQQLITGFSLLIIAYIVQPWPLSPMGQRWPSRLSLVIYLSCLSSSSHLACMLTLHKYLKGHAGLAKLRIFFIILFAMVLAISIGLGQTFSVVGYIQYQILWRVNSDTAYTMSLYIGGALLYGLPPLIALHVYWTAVMQLWPSARHRMKKMIRHFYRRYGRKLVPRKGMIMILGPRWSSKLMSAVKRIFWWLLFLNPPMIFALQIIFAKVSIAFILMQKFAGPTLKDICPDCDHSYMCQGLNNPNENQWGFGQMLAMFVLVLPILAAIETYLEEKTKHEEKMESLEGRAKSTPETPRHSRAGSTVALLSLPTPSPRDSFSVLPSPDVGGTFGRTPSLRSAMSQYMPVPGTDPYGPQYGDTREQTSLTREASGEISELQRLYHPGNL